MSSRWISGCFLLFPNLSLQNNLIVFSGNLGYVRRKYFGFYSADISFWDLCHLRQGQIASLELFFFYTLHCQSKVNSQTIVFYTEPVELILWMRIFEVLWFAGCMAPHRLGRFLSHGPLPVPPISYSSCKGEHWSYQGIESDLCSTKWHTPITLGLEAILEPKPFDFTADRIKRETATRTQWFGALSSCLLCLTVFPIKSL